MLKNKWRLVWMVVVSIAIHHFIHLFTFKTDTNGLYGYFMGSIQSLTITVLIWEGTLRFDKFINRYLPWEKFPGKRILVQIPFGFLYTAAVLYSIMLFFDSFICKMPIDDKQGFYLIVLFISIAIALFILTIEISVQFFRNWKHSLVQLEHYKAQTAQAQLENLKNQVNPHFLFNNMSVLSSLVYKDQDKAVQFINQLSKVYRYLLDNAQHELRTLEEEMQFIRSYTYLLDIRYSPNLVFHIDIESDKLGLLLPPLAIQLLIENAIKHNIVSSEEPLTIAICTLNNQLIVENNLQLRVTKEPSSGTGLKNICLRYSHFTDLEPEITQTEHSFIVKIPLLQPA